MPVAFELSCSGNTELKSLSEQQVLDHSKSSQAGRPQSLSNLPPNEAGKYWVDQFCQINQKIILGARSVVVKLESVATDYDRDLKRYTCQLSVQFDRRALTAILMQDSIDKIEKENPSLIMLTDIAINKNDKKGVDVFFGAVRKAAEAQASSMSGVFLFSVQPKDPEGVGSEFEVTNLPR